MDEKQNYQQGVEESTQIEELRTQVDSFRAMYVLYSDLTVNLAEMQKEYMFRK